MQGKGKFWTILKQMPYAETVVYVFCVGACFIFSCNTKENAPAKTLFTSMKGSATGIDFSNELTYTESFNPYTFRNFYNGGGVAIGDINNDGLPDLFFCSSQHSNRLYLNKGNFKFEDITDKAGVASDSVWSTGVTMADVNGDGLLDIYVCKSGDLRGKNRSNALYINDGGGKIHFTEREIQFIKLICDELTTKEIADKMKISTRTVEEYSQNVKEKIEAKNLVGIALYAIKNNIVSTSGA